MDEFMVLPTQSITRIKILSTFSFIQSIEWDQPKVKKYFFISYRSLHTHRSFSIIDYTQKNPFELGFCLHVKCAYQKKTMFPPQQRPPKHTLTHVFILTHPFKSQTPFTPRSLANIHEGNLFSASFTGYHHMHLSHLRAHVLYHVVLSLLFFAPQGFIAHTLHLAVRAREIEDYRELYWSPKATNTRRLLNTPHTCVTPFVRAPYVG